MFLAQNHMASERVALKQLPTSSTPLFLALA